ncbi:hypothetical protein FRC10_003313 [Ceratobasidium sp. 414]|nr:hypothetical protein FRC10_003313 [Ceratobasidium sp. 414]
MIKATKLASGTTQAIGSSLPYKFPGHAGENTKGGTAVGSSTRIVDVPTNGKTPDVTTKRKRSQDETRENEVPRKGKCLKGFQVNMEDLDNSGGLGVPTELLTRAPLASQLGVTTSPSYVVCDTGCPIDSQRFPLHDVSESAAHGTGRQQPLPHKFPASPINSHELSKSVASNAALDAATAAIACAGTSLDINNIGLLNGLCERLDNPDLYTCPITRQRIIELLEIASKEIAKTCAAGLWEITARVAQEHHFVCPPQMEDTVKSYIKMIDTVNENSRLFDEGDLIGLLTRIQSVAVTLNLIYQLDYTRLTNPSRSRQKYLRVLPVFSVKVGRLRM